MALARANRADLIFGIGVGQDDLRAYWKYYRVCRQVWWLDSEVQRQKKHLEADILNTGEELLRPYVRELCSGASIEDLVLHCNNIHWHTSDLANFPGQLYGPNVKLDFSGADLGRPEPFDLLPLYVGRLGADTGDFSATSMFFYTGYLLNLRYANFKADPVAYGWTAKESNCFRCEDRYKVAFPELFGPGSIVDDRTEFPVSDGKCKWDEYELHMPIDTLLGRRSQQGSFGSEVSIQAHRQDAEPSGLPKGAVLLSGSGGPFPTVWMKDRASRFPSGSQWWKKKDA
ncbi:hypothetical protein BDV96DRAFT_643259 [Lophiotrema nucula]|uniref:Uncharacterized protein n=1 Tax=Lophiotrema nucula TaxID=690887 RepID=A0A6A5ZJR7_9PLEO|nr:hypothetical protein BDV96DRAFT_643259 [Lophiotrema nucula]